jgi:hypothetical protein
MNFWHFPINDRFCSTLQILPDFKRSRIDWGYICAFDLHLFILILQVSRRMRAVLAVNFSMLAIEFGSAEASCLFVIFK